MILAVKLPSATIQLFYLELDETDKTNLVCNNLLSKIAEFSFE